MFATTDIKRIEREYEYKRNEANRLFLQTKENIYKNYPRLYELDCEIKKIGIETAKLSLSSNSSQKEAAQQKLKENLKKFKIEKESIIQKYHIQFTPAYSCLKCNDTGYIQTSEGTSMCSCMKQKLINEAYHNSNMANLKNESFAQLNLALYSTDKNPSLYQSNLSPQENISKIISIAKDFISHFEEIEQKNLLFTGTTGTGKTFLSGAIANEVLKNGYTVLYQTAPILLDTAFEYKYNKDSSNRSLYDNIFHVNLLIIDDLGTENLTSAKFSELFTIINARLIKPNTKTIISTNLSLEDLSKAYDDRLLSRFIGNYSICRFYGNDIRLNRKK